MKQIIYILITLCVLSCSERKDNHNHLYTLSKQMYKNPSIASEFLDTVNIASFNKEELEYCKLIKIQATDLSDNDIKPYTKDIYGIISYMQKKKDYSFLKLAYYYAGRINSESNETEKAVKFYKLATNIKNLPSEINSRSYSQLGNIYYDQYLYDYAIEMYTAAYNEAIKENDAVGMAKILKDQALVFIDKGESATALKILGKALKIAESSKDARCIRSVKSYYIIAYTELNNWHNAQKLLPEILSNINKADSSAVYSIAANVYQHADHKRARLLYTYLKDKGNIYAQEKAYAFFTQESLEEEGNIKGLDYFKKYAQTIEHIRTSKNSEMLAKIKGLNDYQRQEAEIAKISRERNEFKLWCISTIAAIIVTVLLASFLIVRLRRKTKEEKRQVFMLKKLQDEIQQNSDDKIKENNKRINELEIQLKNTNDEKAELQKMLADEKEKLLAQNAINEFRTKEQNQAIESIKRSNIGVIIQKKKTGEFKEHLTQTEKQELENTFDSLLPSFKEKLWSIYDISKRELSICMLIKLGCKPTDMATLLGCTPSAISKARIRLYKKFFNKSGSSEDWDAFILSL